MEDGEGYSGKVPQGNFHTPPLVEGLTIPPSRHSATHLPLHKGGSLPQSSRSLGQLPHQREPTKPCFIIRAPIAGGERSERRHLGAQQNSTQDIPVSGR